MPQLVPTTALRKISGLTKRLRIIQGGTSASKTFSILAYLIHIAQSNDGLVISVVSELLPHLKKGAIRDFTNIRRWQRYWAEDEWSKTEFVYRIPNGSIIEFFSVDDASKAHGPRRNILFVNEANNISFPIYRQFAGRTRKVIILDLNPVAAVSVHDSKMLVLTHQQEGDNWEGVSILRSAYQNWYFKKNFYQIDAVKHERQAVGVVKVKLPPAANATDKENARRAAMNIRANEQAFIEEPKGFEIEFMDMKANTTSDPTNYHDRQILKNMAVQYIDIGASGSSGSFAASNDQRELLEQEQDQAIAEQIVAKINEKVVKTIVDMNFTVTDYPKWRVGRIAKDSVETLSDAVAKMTTAKMLTPTDEDEAHVRKDLVVDRTVTKVAKDNENADKVEKTEVADPVKVDASRALAAAREMKQALNENLYGTGGHATSHAA
jgi:hypothetical protein